MSTPTTDKTCEAYERSVKLLSDLSVTHGFMATAEDVANYKRIWGRDGVIMGLAALMTGDKGLVATFRKTLETLKSHQHETGRMPSNVSVDQGKVSYGTTVGRIDATTWYVIGVCLYFLDTGDQAFWNDFKGSVGKAVGYLECLELNGRGFLYVPQGGDWADEYISDGYVLYDEMLYYLALSAYSKCQTENPFMEKKDYLRVMLRVNYLPRREYVKDPHVYHPAMYERMLKVYKPGLPIAYFSNHSVGLNLDTFAAALLLMSDVPHEREWSAVREAVLSYPGAKDFPILPAFDPVIKPGDARWSGLEHNFLFKFRNHPYRYHNGGRWPLVHGMFLAAIAGEDGAKGRLEAFAGILERDRYEFPEFYDGKTFKAGGTVPLGFSAAAYIFAYKATVEGRKIFGAIDAK